MLKPITSLLLVVPRIFSEILILAETKLQSCDHQSLRTRTFCIYSIITYGILASGSNSTAL